MNEVQLISLFDVVSFIVGIASIVISVTAFVLSILFYRWGKKENEAAKNNIIRIEEKITFLDKLFDQLYTKAFDAVKSHGDEMQRMLKETIGSTSGTNQKNYDLELYLQVSKPGTQTIEQVATAIGLDPTQTRKMIEAASVDPRYKDLGLVINESSITSTPKKSDAGEDQS